MGSGVHEGGYGAHAAACTGDADCKCGNCDNATARCLGGAVMKGIFGEQIRERIASKLRVVEECSRRARESEGRDEGGAARRADIHLDTRRSSSSSAGKCETLHSTDTTDVEQLRGSWHEALGGTRHTVWRELPTDSADLMKGGGCCFEHTPSEEYTGFMNALS